MQSLAFDKMVALYNETRTFDRACFDGALRFLAGRFPHGQYPRLIEAGVGTGRIAFPLLDCGYAVAGVDLSGEMLKALLRRQEGRARRAFCQRADATALPFSKGSFDLAVAVHLFYFIPGWKQAADELLRVCRPGGAVILMHTGSGAEIPALNARYKALCEEAGCAIREIGVKSTREVVAYFEARGCEAEWVRDRWTWTAKVRLDKAMGYLEERAYSFTTVAPDAVHRSATAALREEMRSRHGSLEVEIEVPNQVYLVLVRRRNEHLVATTSPNRNELWPI